MSILDNIFQKKSQTPKQISQDFIDQLPYDAQYIGSFQPLIGWISKTSTTWNIKQSSKSFRSIQEKIGRDKLKIKNTAFTGDYEDTGPKLLYESYYRWLRPLIWIDHGNKLKELMVKLEESNHKLTHAQLEELAKSLIFEYKLNSNKKNQSRITSKQNTEIQSLIDLLPLFKDIPIAYFQDALKRKAKNYDGLIKMMGGILIDSSKITTEEGFRLSPIGLLNLYRHYFYDLGTYLGPPVEHIWVAPFSETELIEVWSQTSYRFSESETSYQLTQSEEKSVSEAQELSEEMQRKNEQDFKTGFTANFGFDIAVAQGNGSLSMEYGMHLTNDKKTVRKRSREQSSKTSFEMKRSVRLLTRESLETRTESTRRHVLKNTTDKLVSYEMRRKYRKVGIKVQHLGTQLCWQLIIEEPGKDIGLAELVHIAKPEDFNTIPPPDAAPPSYETISEDYQFNVPYTVTDGDGNHDGDFNDGENTEDFTGRKSKIKTRFRFSAPSPQPGYLLSSIVEKSFERTDPEEDKPSLWAVDYSIINASNGQFEAYLKNVNFENQPSIQVIVSLTWKVKEDVRLEAENEYLSKMAQYEQKKQKEAQAAIVEELRERINLARSIEPRSSEDLRQEERTILFRRTLKNLLGNGLSGSELYATSDVIRTFFEVDKMLYFVAPDWWNPKISTERTSYLIAEIAFNFTYEFDGKTFYYAGFIEKADPLADKINYRYTVTVGGFSRDYSNTVDNPKDSSQEFVTFKFSRNEPRDPDAPPGPVVRRGPLEHDLENPFYQGYDYSTSGINKVRFGSEQIKRPNNYMITEDSEPAPLGSSIGWLTQLDGDMHRNAFLNCAWARVVIPIRRGREEAAKEWLKQEHIEGDEGFNNNMVDENGKEIDKTVEKGIQELIDSLSQTTDDDIYIHGQEVYETGFDPHADAIDPGPAPLDVFAQWVEVVPTNQVVPVNYPH